MKVISYNYQIYFFLIFPLEKINKYKSINNIGFNSNTVDIYDCFDYYKKINFASGENAMYCDYCKHTCNSSMQTNLTTGPEILIIILNRGEKNEYNVKINFYQELNLYNYIELNQTGFQYELIGIITNTNNLGFEGHFVAYCKELWNNQWFTYDDTSISQINDFKGEVIDLAIPYILFYQKKKNEC